MRCTCSHQYQKCSFVHLNIISFSLKNYIKCFIVKITLSYKPDLTIKVFSCIFNKTKKMLRKTNLWKEYERCNSKFIHRTNVSQLRLTSFRYKWSKTWKDILIVKQSALLRKLLQQYNCQSLISCLLEVNII